MSVANRFAAAGDDLTMSDGLLGDPRAFFTPKGSSYNPAMSAILGRDPRMVMLKPSGPAAGNVPHATMGFGAGL